MNNRYIVTNFTNDEQGIKEIYIQCKKIINGTLKGVISKKDIEKCMVSIKAIEKYDSSLIKELKYVKEFN